MAAGHPLTARAASMVLEAGGNAFDAVIAALWTACLTEPVLASLGGGGFLLGRTANGEAVVHDFFVHTPSVRRPTSELNFYPIDVDFGVATQQFHIGPGAAAVPGFTRGLFSIHRAHASMPMTELVAPALELTRGGVEMTDYQAYLLSVVGPIYRETREARELFMTSGEAGPGAMLRTGERQQNPDLAQTLEALAREGERLFYEGELASAMVGQCREHGGYLTAADLRNYEALRRSPLTCRYRDSDLLLNAPPASGGMLIAFGLGLLG
ncbi:MAG: gamma-glutamyltransferase, partial [Nannocystaceae bacterium]